MGRFLNADAFASTGQGLLGNNMFAYCGNNPVNYSDPSGHAYQGIYSQINYNEYEHMYGGLRENFYARPSSWNKICDTGFDHHWDLYDNRDFYPDSIYHEEIFAININNPSLSLRDLQLTLGEIEFTVMTGGWEFGNLDISLFDLGYAGLSAGLSNGTLGFEAIASFWHPSVTVSIYEIDISVSAHVGSVGGEFIAGKNGFKAGAAFGWGASVAVSW